MILYHRQRYFNVDIIFYMVNILNMVIHIQLRHDRKPWKTTFIYGIHFEKPMSSIMKHGLTSSTMVKHGEHVLAWQSFLTFIKHIQEWSSIVNHDHLKSIKDNHNHLYSTFFAMVDYGQPQSTIVNMGNHGQPHSFIGNMVKNYQPWLNMLMNNNFLIM